MASSKDFFTRLERIRLLKQWTWQETGEAVGLSRTMIHFIKTGKHGVTDKALHRLEEAEIEAGLLSPNDAAFSRMIRDPEFQEDWQVAMSQAKAMLRRTKEIAGAVTGILDAWRKADRIKVTDADVRRGFVEIALEYRLGAPPRGKPTQLRLKAIGSLEAAKLLPRIVSQKSSEEVLLKALDSEYRKDSFLNLLTPVTIVSMMCVTVLLTYGLRDGRNILQSLGYEFETKG